jgi:hypothetical protein
MLIKHMCEVLIFVYSATLKFVSFHAKRMNSLMAIRVCLSSFIPFLISTQSYSSIHTHTHSNAIQRKLNFKFYGESLSAIYCRSWPLYNEYIIKYNLRSSKSNTRNINMSTHFSFFFDVTGLCEFIDINVFLPLTRKLFDDKHDSSLIEKFNLSLVGQRSHLDCRYSLFFNIRRN